MARLAACAEIAGVDLIANVLCGSCLWDISSLKFCANVDYMILVCSRGAFSGIRPHGLCEGHLKLQLRDKPTELQDDGMLQMRSWVRTQRCPAPC